MLASLISGSACALHRPGPAQQDTHLQLTACSQLPAMAADAMADGPRHSPPPSLALPCLLQVWRMQAGQVAPASRAVTCCHVTALFSMCCAVLCCAVLVGGRCQCFTALAMLHGVERAHPCCSHACIPHAPRAACLTTGQVLLGCLPESRLAAAQAGMRGVAAAAGMRSRLGYVCGESISVGLLSAGPFSRCCAMYSAPA